MVATSAAQIGRAKHTTGLWLEELTSPYYAFVDAGAQVTVASIAGGAIPVDPNSIDASNQDHPSVKRYGVDLVLQERLSSTSAFAVLDSEDFDALFLPGGHGTMADYPGNAALAKLVARYDAAEKLIAAVCHGPAGLVSARKADGSSVLQGRKVTGFTDSEERAVGLADIVPFLLETRLRDLGAEFHRGPDFEPFVVRDRNLITGQNPASAAPAAATLLEAFRDPA
ncbi:type 1 glutamine amidotransferase domain-containing protein [Sphingobium sp. BHU LFT2]|nr:type 1 glutamine amidotransferase domain-containing protein [Sphingobium sp. BHU LFT2]